MRSAVVIIVCFLASLAHAGAPREQFDKAKDAFRKKDCGSAMPSLKDVLYPDERLADRDSLFEARAMLGACFADSGESAKAKIEFERALQLKPKAELDSLFYSERAVRLFDDTKAEIENRARRDEEVRKLQAEREALEAYRESLRVYRVNPYAVNFAPFGLGQLQNGQRLKAALFAGGQIAALSTSVGIWYYLVNKYGIRSTQVPLDDGPRVRRYQQFEIGAGLAFYGLYAWSVIDALRNYEPKKRVEGDDDLLREEKQKATDKQKTPPKSSFFKKLHVSPMASQTSVGIGIGWEN
ncbi:MAG TPA: hypothetical protein VIV40_25250 [Kofleriaceae bacterium]